MNNAVFRNAVVMTYGDDLSTDIIYPGAYLYCTDAKRTPQFCFKVRGDDAFNLRLEAGEIPAGDCCRIADLPTEKCGPINGKICV